MPPSKNISFEELSKYFHLPINQVAKELGVCATILKKICRRNGIPRWPHRKIKSLDKMISNLELNLQGKSPQDQAEVHRELSLLTQKKNEILKNPDVLAKVHSLEFCLKPAAKKLKTTQMSDVSTERSEPARLVESPTPLKGKNAGQMVNNFVSARALPGSEHTNNLEREVATSEIISSLKNVQIPQPPVLMENPLNTLVMAISPHIPSSPSKTSSPNSSLFGIPSSPSPPSSVLSTPILNLQELSRFSREQPTIKSISESMEPIPFSFFPPNHVTSSPLVLPSCPLPSFTPQNRAAPASDLPAWFYEEKMRVALQWREAVPQSNGNGSNSLLPDLHSLMNNNNEINNNNNIESGKSNLNGNSSCGAQKIGVSNLLNDSSA